MRNHGLGSWTARRARKTPNKAAIVAGERRFDYADLHRRATAMAHVLREHGIRSGDRVAYLGPNDPAFLETLFATGMLGAVFVPLNTRLAGPELAHCLNDSGAAVLLHAPEYRDTVAGSGDAVRHRIPIDDGYERLLDAASTDPIDEPVGETDTCMIMYTSGTTGKPKGAVLTHGNITWNALNVLVDIDLAGDEITLVVAPLFHTAGLNMTCLPTLLKGGTVVLEPRFDPARTLELIAAERVTYMFGVPAMYDAITACPDWPDADLSSLRQINCGGAPVPPETIRTYQERGLAFSQGYGMTEASPGTLYLARDDSIRKSGTAGVPHFFTDVRVVDPSGEDIRPGENGEVLVSGPNVMAGYWGLADESARALDGGWFHTGDIATLDDDGYITIVDRLKDMIISGGENIYPAEVESALHDHPEIADAAVIGVPDDKWGEVGRAIVVPTPATTPTETELLEFLTGKLARYKLPKSVVFTDELPRNTTGKLLKKHLRDTHGHTDPETKDGT